MSLAAPKPHQLIVLSIYVTHSGFDTDMRVSISFTLSIVNFTYTIVFLDFLGRMDRVALFRVLSSKFD